MFKIKHVEINNIWGEYSLKVPLDEENNLFIGKNGTGKSTFLNILTAVLLLDKQSLAYYEFSDIKILFSSGGNQKTLQVEKRNITSIRSTLRYKLSSKIIGEIRVDSREEEYYYRGELDDSKIINLNLEKLVIINDLSTARISRSDDLETLHEKYTRRKVEKMELMDKKIEILIDGLQKYRFGLERKLSESSKQFQQEVLEALMYNKEWDKAKQTQDNYFDQKELEEGIKDAYIEFGFGAKEATKKAREYIKNTFSKNLKLEDTQSLLFRIQYVLEKLNILKKTKQEIMSSLNDLVKILNLFIEDKNFSFDGFENLIITKNEKTLKIKDLSSGEKQLLILFLQTLLQDKKEVIFIADEPELSLHMVWQRNLIKAIKVLNPNSQIIFATHSTEICGLWRDSIKRLEDFICKN